MAKKNQIAFLGPIGTYSDEAAHLFAEHLGIESPEFLECPSFNEVFDAVDRGRCEYGVVPMENSLEGSVTSTLDNFAFSSPATILGQTVLSIHHCLLLHPDAELSDVTTVASHPQGLAQCRRYLASKLPNAKTVTTSSTAESARLAAGDVHTAGIANAYAARIHGAKVVETDVEDHFGNQTAFVLIGRQGHPQVLEGKRQKTSLALFLKEDRAGALLMILSELAYAGINMTRLQSRPTKQQLGNYMFFVDFEGDAEDPSVQTALNCLRMKLREVKVLGTYPVLDDSDEE